MINIEPIEILQQHDDIFSTTNNFIIYIFRFFWYILSSLQLIVASLESALNEMFKHLDFFNSTKMMSFMQSMKPITSALLVIGILIIGFKLMTNTLREKRGILLNFIFVVIIFSGFQTLLVQFSNFTSTTANAFMDINGSSVSQNIIKNSITDLKYLDENNFSDTSLSNKNNINPQNIMKIDPVELMIPKETNNKAVFENKLVIDTSGNLSTKKLDDGHFLGMGSDMFSSYYYRYKIEWVNLTITLIFLGLSLVWSCIKVAELIYQLGITVAITPFVTVLDVSTGQRTKKVLQKILNIFLVIISVAFMYRIFYLGIDFIQSIPDLNIWVETFLIVGFSLGLIKGSYTIEELLGIDVGTSASNMFYTTQMIGGTVKTALNTPKNIANALGKGAKNIGGASSKTASAIAGISGYANGRTKGLNELKEEKEQNANNNSSINSDNNLHNLKPDKNTSDNKENNLHQDDNTSLDNNLNGVHQDDNISNNNLHKAQTNNNDNNNNDLHTSKQDINNSDDKANNIGDNNSTQQNTADKNLNSEAKPNNNLHSSKQDNSKSDNIQNNNKATGKNNNSNINIEKNHNNNNNSTQPNNQSNISQNNTSKQEVNLSQTNSTHNKDTTTTLGDLAKQHFYQSTFGRNIKSIQNTYNKAYQIGENTKRKAIEQSSNKKKRNDKK